MCSACGLEIGHMTKHGLWLDAVPSHACAEANARLYETLKRAR